MPALQVPADVGVVLLAQEPGGGALEGADELGELDFAWVVHEKADVVLFAVELLQLGFEVLNSRASAGFRFRLSS